MDEVDNIRIMQNYYFLSPLFLLADKALGFNVRVTMPAGFEALEYLYYLTCFAGAFLFYKYKTAASLFCLAECAINLLLLILSVFLPIVTLGNTESSASPFGMAELTHFLLAGSLMIFCFHSNPLFHRS
ncbi:MAG: hypothetical protein KDI30_09235 [Pseudomonadales bacterium]|nr:hypothetical protein [Pseudomonadales bacterium]